MREDTLHKAVVAFLARALPLDAVFFHPPNGERRDARTAAKLKDMGVTPGIPDLVILYKGMAHLLELKSSRGALSGAQKQLHPRLRLTGFDVLICRSIDEVETALLRRGIPLRARIGA